MFFVAKATFVVRRVSSIFFKKKKSKRDFPRTSKNSKNPITENQKINSRRDLLDKWFLLPKKR